MITVSRLSSDYYLVRGDGPYEWAQPPSWPCDEATLLAHTFLQASADFRKTALRRMELDAQGHVQ
jgi:hypothetical protein